MLLFAFLPHVENRNLPVCNVLVTLTPTGWRGSFKEEKSKYVYILFMYRVTFSICWHKFEYFFNTLASQNVGLLSTISSKPFTLCELKYKFSQIGLLCNMIFFIAGQSVLVYHLQFNIRMSFSRLLRSSFLPRSL